MTGSWLWRRVLGFSFLLVAACNSTDDVVGTNSADAKAQLVAAAAQKVREAPLVSAAGRLVLQVWPLSVDCPATFDLGDGVTGSCVELDEGGYGYYGSTASNITQTISTTASLPGLDLPFELRVDPFDGGADYSLTVFGANANVAQGDGAWSLQGTVYTTGAGALTGSDLQLRVSQGSWWVRPGWIELPAQGNGDVTTLVYLGSGAGTISFGSQIAANVQVSDGCVTVDFIDPAKQDESTCQW